jgi:hypothetical protein
MCAKHSKEGGRSREPFHSQLGMLRCCLYGLQGIYSAFVCFAVGSLIAVVPTALLPFGPLHAKLDGVQSAHGSDDGGRLASEAAAPGGEGAAGCREGVGLLVLHADGSSAPSHKRVVPHDLVGGLARDGAMLGKAGDNGRHRSPHEWGEHGTQPPPNHPPTAALAGSPDATGLAGPAPAKVHYWRGLAQLFSDLDVCVFFAQCIFLGFGVGNIENFLFLYLDELGASETLMGLTLTVTCVAGGWAGSAGGVVAWAHASTN